MKRSVAGVLAVVGLACTCGTAHGQFTWTAFSSGNWSDSTRWLSGNVPPIGGSSTALVTFQSNGVVPWTATNDRGSPFALSGLILAGLSPATSAVAGSPLQFEASGIVVRNGPGGFAVTTPITLNGGLSFLGGGPGPLALSGAISGPGSLSIDGFSSTNPLINTITVGGAAANTFTGGTALNGGTLLMIDGAGQPLGTGTVTVTSGQIGSAGTVTVPNTFVFNNALNLVGSGAMTMTGALTGPGELRVRNQGSTSPSPAMLDLRGVSTYSGATVLQQTTLHTSVGGGQNPALGAPRVMLSQGGSILNTSSIEVQGGGALVMNNTGQVLQRLSASTPISLKSAELVLQGNATTSIHQLLGPVSGSGYSVLSVEPGTAGARMTAASLTRTDQGVFLFRGPNLGNVPAAGRSNISFVTPPTLVGGGGADGQTTKSIIPFAVGSAGGVHATDLVTYGANGVRLLTSGEYQPFLGANVTDNVLLEPDMDNFGPVVVNSLVTRGSVAGGGTILITSGMWLTSPTANAPQSMFNGINLGAGGQVVVGGVNAPAVTMEGVLTGHDLAKAGDGALILNNVGNVLTGTLSVGAGTLSFSNPAQLGAVDAIRCTFGSSTPALQYTGAGTVLSKNIIANSGHFRVAASGAGAALTLSGTVSGPGGLQTYASGAGASIVLSGANTYEGGTRIANGDLVFSGDGNLGAAAGGIDLGTDSTSEGIRLTGNWTTSRPMHVSLPSRINTQSNSATLNGGISGPGALTKAGTGTLTLNGINTYNGPITIGQAGVFSGGSLVVNGITLSAVTVSDGTLGGDGVVGAVTVLPAGVVAPGNGVGSLDVKGAFSSSGTLRIELGGTSAGNDYDQLLVTGAATLSGTLQVSLINGFQPAPGSTFTVLTANGVSGTFASLSLPPGMTVAYSPTGVTLSLPGAVCDSVDFNGDTLFPDTQDIADFLTVFGGGVCPTGTCGDIDFNNDGLFPDTDDIAALLRVFGGGACV